MVLYSLKVDFWRLVLYLQAVLASILLVRVLLQPFHSIRRILIFALLPTIANPSIFLLRRFAVDYRITWLEFRLFEWVCIVGLVYSLLTGLLRNLPGVSKLFRTVSAITFVGSLGTAVAEGQYLLSPQIASLTAEAFVLDRAILATAGLLLVSIFAFVFWFRIQVSKNLALVSSGLSIHLAAQSIQIVLSEVLRRYGISLRELSAIVWIAFLTYWTLFLSSRDEGMEKMSE